ncbi:MAG: MBL fold metallo-hydrolase [Clostridia bacterium]|nr:MBL fold metallo-hydrolase [Clostridia bacterium]
MKKTYVTNMPNHIGAFLKASKCFSELGINITRVSYNKAVDSHTLFIDVEGEEKDIKRADKKLQEIGYLSNGAENSKITLLEFVLEDKAGSVTKVLEIISEFNFNISYMSSQENGSGFQRFKMGLYENGSSDIERFIERVKKICEVNVIDYNRVEKVYDNSLFYSSYSKALVDVMGLPAEKTKEVLVNVNLAMQTLDEKGLSPYKTFDSISRFAELLAECKADSFKPRISEYNILPNTKITLIEPNCGSNTAIIESNGERLFVDSGYACYRNEMLKIINELVADFGKREEQLFITHADVDHCGLANDFDFVVVGERTADCLIAESELRFGYRENNPLHRPYVNICKILTEYKPIKKEKVFAKWKKSSLSKCLEKVGEFKVGELDFSVYEGKGGHLLGETLLIDFNNKIAFTGDVFININGLTPKQAEYNKYAPILMTSVDTNPLLCAEERKELLDILGDGNWKIFGGHGKMKEYCKG